jgi:hypothetical protein
VVRELGSWVRVSWPEAQDGVGYLHTAWGTISHGTTVQAAAATTADTPAARPAFESAWSPGRTSRSRPVDHHKRSDPRHREVDAVDAERHLLAARRSNECYLDAPIHRSRGQPLLRSSFGFPDIVENGIGAQLLGGAEFTWASAPQVAVSADLRQQWAPATFDGFELGGFAASVSVHWYMK